MTTAFTRRRAALVAASAATLLGAVLNARCRPVATASVALTVGDVRALHADVSIGGRGVTGDARLRDGDEVTTEPEGRARLRLDDGTVVIVDGSTTLGLHGARMELARGRIFVQAGATSKTEVAVDAAVTTVSSSAAAFEKIDKPGSRARIYCALGELVITAGSRQEHVASGETASLTPDGPKVAPETAFDDWTGGLAVPWSGESGPESAIPAMWGGSGGEDPGSPLVVRSEKIDVKVDGEVAVTRTRARYFNGSDQTVVADIRMALPPGAILSRVATADEESREADATLEVGRRDRELSTVGRLEWAGGGWLRGTLPGLGAGKTVDLLVDYVEWLPERDGHASYRFPMASEGPPALVGELSATVAGAGKGARWLSTSAGSSVQGANVELRRADVRPTGDLVVELASPVVREGAARAYVAPGEKGEDPYVLVRTEVPAAAGAGVTLALVLDTSMSVGPSSFEMERAVVDALVEGLGPRDSLVVFAADQTVRPVGPARPAPVGPELRETIRKELAGLRTGGASSVALALEQAADAVDAAGQAGSSGMVVYLGDGWPTVGETTARDIRRRLARRAGGVPRIGAVSIGHAANRWMLAKLVAGSGPIYQVIDRPDAARAGAAILADALEPTLRDVELDLGPTIDRIYPREARAALAGSTVTVVGRLRGKLPGRIGFRHRRGAELVEESRSLDAVELPEGADVSRRWAAARIEEMAARGDGVEPAIALAAQAKLLTPWTSWFFSGSSSFDSAPFEIRLLALSPLLDAPFADAVAPGRPPATLLLEPHPTLSGGASLLDAAEAAAQRAIDASMDSIIACRDSRAAVRQEVTGSLRVEVVVDAAGHATTVRVAATDIREDDAVLDRCVRGVVTATSFVAVGVRVSLKTSLTLPPARSSRRTQCSAASTLPLAVRRGIWRVRKRRMTLDYVTAARGCELPTWSDRREMLLMLMEGLDATAAFALVNSLERAGETDAASFLRPEILRNAQITTATNVDWVRKMLVGDEPDVDLELDKAYGKAKNDEDRLAVVRKFLRLAPHGALARRRLLALLESMGRRDALVDEIAHLRSDPFADAGLLAQGASALRRVGLDAEGRRAFGELIERAPGDPWTLAYVGDRLRGEGLFDDAAAAYERLDRAMPDDPGVTLRLAMAHAGAGRLDVAARLLDRVGQTGGRGNDGRLGELASVTAAALLAAAREAKPAPSPETDALLVRRMTQTPLPDVASLILVKSAPADDALQVRIARGEKDRDEDPPDLDASVMGLSALRIERGSGVARIRLRRTAAAGPGQPSQATVMAVVLSDDRSIAKLVTREVSVEPGDKDVELRWNGESLL